MRKWISIVLVLSLVTMLTGVASAIEAGEDVALPLYTSSGEEKVYCNATVEDDFAENRIMVVLSNDASLQFNSYEAADFWEIDCAGVQDLSQASGRKIQAKAEAVKAAVMTRSVDVSTLDTSGIDTYNQVLCLDLEESGKENVLAAIDELMARDDVVYAGPDYVLTLCSTTPDGTYYYDGGNWATDVIDLPEAWDITTGSSEAVVAVIDSGIDASHEDLEGRVPLGYSWDFTTGIDVNVIPTDTNGHGTHVAGIIGAIANNQNGIAGVCWNVTLASMRILNDQGYAYSSHAIMAIYCADLMNIPIINFSIGYFPQTNSFSEYYDVPMQEAISSYSGLFICAAGNYNSNNDEDDFFPAVYDLPNLISVGASDSEDEVWDIGTHASNYGQRTVDLFAPGGSIYSTYCNDSYEYMSGTSMATPYVTGVAALLMTIHPNREPFEIKQVIMSTVDVISSFQGLCVSGGRLNACNALSYEFPHIYIKQKYNTQKHMVTCTDCGDTYLEPHTWNATHTKCLVCGYNIGVPNLMRVLLPDNCD